MATIIDALAAARFPLVLVGHSGRNPKTVPLLATLSHKLALGLFGVGCSALGVPYDHPHFLGMSFGGKNPLLAEADVLLLLDTEVPWIDAAGNAPAPGARVFVLSPDPLLQTYGWAHVDADLVCRVDPALALEQLLHAVDAIPADTARTARAGELLTRHDALLATLTRAEAPGPSATSPFVLATLREAAAAHRVLWLNEGISNYPAVFDHIRPVVPGSMVCSGGSSLGWALGAAVGIGLGRAGDHELRVAIVGDGTFMFGVPSSAYWMARRYNAVRVVPPRGLCLS